MQFLHDAFFKYQTKLKLSSYSDLYYKGKEFEVLLICYILDVCNGDVLVFKPTSLSTILCSVCTQQVKLREMKPVMLLRELKEAPGMLDGAPLPWLINMQV